MDINATLKQHGLKITQNRRTVLEGLMAHTKPITVKELMVWVIHKSIKIDQVTLYRTVETLHQKGIIEKIDFRQGVYRYELQTHHHHHIVCQSCAAIVELENDAVDVDTQKAAKQTGFAITDHSLELYGLCPRCQIA